ncbi:alpha/beta hydrolase family esterase [Echinicola shivajiensis]|uniref:alpha/beta hydrolase family esterase n=1 Tax=Echinicola shivajiensis TaxID=1035916 RepID=UPI001BFC7FA0|nr:PHB depolymerase family esterase [Echinicola shivajiensis]
MILTVFSTKDPVKNTILVDGIDRSFILDLPQNPNDKIPLLIVLHGGFGSGQQAKDSYSLTPISHQNDYAVVYPDGIDRKGRLLNIRTWNAGGCCGYAAKNEVDDVKFISKLIDKLVAEQGIDPKKVFVTGMSNGAMMAYRLACEIPEKIRAIAPVAGTILPVKSCGSAVPIIHFHSKEDQNVPLEGGKGNGPSGFDFPSLEEVIANWEEINQCEEMETLKNNGYTLYQWNKGSVPMKYYITDDGGHSWPGAEGKPWRKADAPSQILDANHLIFDFFNTLE